MMYDPDVMDYLEQANNRTELKKIVQSCEKW